MGAGHPDFQKALRIKPAATIYANLGLVCFYSGRYKESTDAHAKALALDPNSALALANLADDYRQSGDTSKAASYYQQAIAAANHELQVNPREIDTMRLLGEIYAKIGNTSDGREFIRRARSVDPGQVDLMYSTALVEASAGNKAFALESLRNALRHGFPWRHAQAKPDFMSLREDARYKSLIADYASKRN